MDKFMDVLIHEHLEPLMMKSRQRFAMSNEVYRRDLEDAANLEERYQALVLEKKDRLVMNDYIACLQTAGERASELAYMAGASDMVKLLHRLNVIDCIAE